MGLRARLRDLERQSKPGGRVVVVHPSGGPSTEERPDGGLTLRPAPGHETDPMRGLTADQRAMIRPDDTCIVVCYSETWPPGPADTAKKAP